VLTELSSLEDAIMLNEHTPVLEAVTLGLMKMCKPNTHSRIECVQLSLYLSIVVLTM
jgi:hypothetical protein